MHFNPRAPCGARHAFVAAQKSGALISTHAPLAGRDDINIVVQSVLDGFQPTRPLRGATGAAHAEILVILEFQPTRPLRGATQTPSRRAAAGNTRQPTRPLRGATYAQDPRQRHDLYFNPRAPCGARQFQSGFQGNPKEISTHAPLAGRDECKTPISSMRIRISTHAPLAGRDGHESFYQNPWFEFQPTRPLRGATAKVYKSLCTFLR